MNYKFTFTNTCEKTINKATRKNPILEKVLTRKINQIILNPHRYKPLRHDLAGERRVHIMSNLILKFIIDEQNKIVIFIFFGHNDKTHRLL